MTLKNSYLGAPTDEVLGGTDDTGPAPGGAMIFDWLLIGSALLERYLEGT
jgi:hypothetical protein